MPKEEELKNSELSWIFSLLGDREWYVIAFRRILGEVPDFNRCKHREIEWLWAHPSSSEVLLYDWDDRELSDITHMRRGQPVNMEQAVKIVLLGGWHLLSAKETHMPVGIQPIATRLEQLATAAAPMAEVERLTALALATPGTEERTTLERELDGMLFQVHDQDIRNLPCLECQANL